MDNYTSYKTKKPIKILVSIICIMIIGIALWGIEQCFNDGDLYSIYFYCLPILVIMPLALISTYSRTIRIGPDYIEKINFGSVVILFSEIKQIDVNTMHIVIISGKKRIPTNSDLQNQKPIIRQIFEIVGNNPSVRIRGNQKAINKYIQSE